MRLVRNCSERDGADERRRAGCGYLVFLPLIGTLILVLGIGIYAALFLWRGSGNTGANQASGVVEVAEGITYSHPGNNHVLTDDNGTTYVDNEVVVYAALGGDQRGLVRRAEGLSGMEVEVVGQCLPARCFQLRFSGEMSLDVLEEICDGLLSDDESVACAIPQYVLETSCLDQPTSDPAWSEDPEEGMPSKTWGLEEIHVPEAWELVRANSDIRVGVLDGQFFTDHEDLNEAIVETMPFSDSQFAITSAKVGEDGHEWREPDVHGTHVAGIIGAQNNDKGSVGVAHGVSLYGYSAYGTDSEGNPKITTPFDFAVGLSYLVSSCECTVINASIEYEDLVLQTVAENRECERRLRELSDAAATAINSLIAAGYDDFIICQAAGNSGEQGAKASMGMLGGVDDVQASSRIIVVGALELAGDGGVERSSKTSAGKRVDVWAPGNNIYSCSYRVGLFGDPVSDYAYLSGSSMAAPMVSGVAALVRAANPSLTGDQVKDVIVSTKGGAAEIVDARSAVELAQGYFSGRGGGGQGESGEPDAPDGSLDNGSIKRDETSLGSYEEGASAHRLFLDKIEELEREYGGPGYTAPGNGVDGWGAAYASGLCFADIVDFGDGIERLVTTHLNVPSGDRPDGFWPTGTDYTADVWEYDGRSDKLANVYSEPLTGGSTGDFDLSLRGIAAALGCDINWDEDAIEYRIVVVSDGGYSPEETYQSGTDVSGIDVRSMEEAATSEKETVRELRNELGA